MENKQTASYISTGKGLLALSPIVVFLLLYVAVSVIIGDFYKMPLSIAFIIASMWALLLRQRRKSPNESRYFQKAQPTPMCFT